MPQAIRFGMDCQTFWRSNPKRLGQFCEGRKYIEDIDKQAWATGVYVARAFAGKIPSKPDLFEMPTEGTPQTAEQEAENAAKQFEAWAHIFNEQFKKRHEGGDTECPM